MDHCITNMKKLPLHARSILCRTSDHTYATHLVDHAIGLEVISYTPWEGIVSRKSVGKVVNAYIFKDKNSSMYRVEVTIKFNKGIKADSRELFEIYGSIPVEISIQEPGINTVMVTP